MAIPSIGPQTTAPRTPKPPGYEEDEYYQSLPESLGGGTVPQIPGLGGQPPGPQIHPPAPGGGFGEAQPTAQATAGTMGTSGGGATANTTQNLLTEAARLTGQAPPEDENIQTLYDGGGGNQYPYAPIGTTVQGQDGPGGGAGYQGDDPEMVRSQTDTTDPVGQVQDYARRRPGGRDLSPSELEQLRQAIGYTGGPLTPQQQQQAQQLIDQFFPGQGGGGQPPPGQPPDGQGIPVPGGGTIPPAEAERQARDRFRQRFNRDLNPTEWTTLLSRVPGYQPGQPITQAMMDAAFQLIDQYDGNLPGGGGGGPVPPPRAPVPTPRTPTPTVPYEPYTPRPRTPIPAARPYVAPDAPWGEPIQSTVTPPPTFRAPTYNGPDPYAAPAPFQYDPYQQPDAFQFREHDAQAGFVAPTMEEALNDPGYQFMAQQGAQRLEQSAAAGGVLRTGGTLKDLLKYGQDMATTRYGDVYNRRASEWDRANAANTEDYTLDRDTASGTFDRNTAMGERAYDRNRAGAEGAYDRNAATGRYAHESATDAAGRRYSAAFEGAQAEFDPQFAGWQAKTSADQRNSELNFDRNWQKELKSRDDSWRNYQFGETMEADRLRYEDQAGWERETFQRGQDVDRARYINDDAYRRDRDANDRELQTMFRADDDAWRRFVNSQDQAWRREELEESRRRWIVEQGLR